MTTATILKAINALPAKERLNIIEQIIRTMRLEEPDKPAKKVKGKKNPDNPSPSGDPWFDDPRNLAILDEAIQSMKEDKDNDIVFKSAEDIKKYFANL